MRTSKRFSLRWFFVVLALLLLPFGLLLCVYYSGKVRLLNAIAELKAAGYATSLIELAPPPVPDTENAAPLYEQAFAKFVQYSGNHNDQDNPTKKAETGFERLAPVDKDKLRSWLADNGPAFDLVTRARQRPRCRYARDYAAGLALEPDGLASIKEIVNALRLRALVEADTGSGDRVRDTLLDSIALADSLRDEPILLSQLVRVACHGILADAAGRCVDAKTEIGSLQSWRSALPSPDSFDTMLVLAVRGELASTAQMFTTGALATQPPMGPIDMNVLVFMRGEEAVKTLSALRRLADCVARPTVSTRQSLEDIKTELAKGSTEPYGFFGVVPDGILLSWTSVKRLQATLSVLRAGMECEIEFKTRGCYPARVDAADPITGRPLIYKPDGGLLYSVGENGRDDGGMTPLEENGEGNDLDDLVWRLRQHAPEQSPGTPKTQHDHR